MSDRLRCNARECAECSALVQEQHMTNVECTITIGLLRTTTEVKYELMLSQIQILFIVLFTVLACPSA